jgi:DUF1009 family protein
MKTIKFEDLLKEYDEMVRQTEDFAKAYKAMVEANVAKLMMERIERHPKFHRNMNADEAGVTEAEINKIFQQAEVMTETHIKSMIEQGARRAYHSIVSAPEPPVTKQ